MNTLFPSNNSLSSQDKRQLTKKDIIILIIIITINNNNNNNNKNGIQHLNECYQLNFIFGEFEDIQPPTQCTFIN